MGLHLGRDLSRRGHSAAGQAAEATAARSEGSVDGESGCVGDLAQAGQADLGPRKGGAARTVGADEGRRIGVVAIVIGVEFDDEPPRLGEHLAAACQQGCDVSPDADIAVEEQRGAPEPLRRNTVEHLAERDGQTVTASQRDDLGRDIQAEGHETVLARRPHHPAGTASDVEHGTGGVPQQ